MTVAIIGAGSVGGALGAAWAGKGREVVYGMRRPTDDRIAALARR